MTLRVYGIRNCDTMKKAFAWLDSRGLTWRGIPEADRTPLSEAKALKLLEKNPSAIRRPIVEAGSRLVIGFDPAEFAKL